MDPMTFIAEMTKALAWPAALVTIFLLVRRQLLGMLPSLDTFEWKDFKLKFGRRVEEVAEKAREALPEPEVRQLPPPSGEEQRLKLADLAPRAAILEAWISLEQAAFTALRRKGITLGDQDLYRPRAFEGALLESELLNPAQLQVLRELRKLRNQAAHASDPKISADTAEEFVEAAGGFERFIKARTPAA